MTKFLIGLLVFGSVTVFARDFQDEVLFETSSYDSCRVVRYDAAPSAAQWRNMKYRVEGLSNNHWSILASGFKNQSKAYNAMSAIKECR